MKRTVCRTAASVLMISEPHEGLCKIRNPEPGTRFSLTDPLSVLIYVLAKTKETVHEKPKLINK